MLWFSMQSLPMLLLAFVVGLLVGWLAWGRQWQPVQDDADLDAPRESRHRADDRLEAPAGGAAPVSVSAAAAAEAVTEPSRLDALLASLTAPDETRNVPTVRVSPRAASESVGVPAVTEPEPSEASGHGYVGGSTHQGALEAASRIAAASQRVADRAAAAPPTDHGGSGFRTSFEPATDPFGLALGASVGDEKQTTDEITLAAFGEHLSQSSVQPRTASVFHEDDDLVTVLNQSTHAPATLDPEPAMIDDLTRIEGVNSAMAAALSAEGLRTYEDIAQATEDRLRRALRIARIRSAPGIGFWAPRAARLAQQRCDDQVPSDQVLIDDVPVDDLPVDDVPVDDVPADDDGPADGVAPDEVAADTLTGDVLTHEDSTDEDSTDEDSADEDSTDEDSADEDSADEPVAQAHVPEPGSPEVEGRPAGGAETLDEDSFDSLLTEPLTAADYAELTIEPEPAADVVPLPVARTDVPSTPRHAEASGADRAGWLTDGDDLEQIGGVGRRISEVLNAAGITSFVQLAAARDHELKAILAEAEVRQPASLVTWSVQAALLLQGDVEGAATLADGLMTGRETG